MFVYLLSLNVHFFVWKNIVFPDPLTCLTTAELYHVTYMSGTSNVNSRTGVAWYQMILRGSNRDTTFKQQLNSPTNKHKNNNKNHLTATCWPRRWRILRTTGPGSKHSALCPPLGPPPWVPGCHGDGGPSGTSGWNLGPFYSARRKWRRANVEVESTECWWNASLKIEQNVTLHTSVTVGNWSIHAVTVGNSVGCTKNRTLWAGSPSRRRLHLK